MKQRFFLFASIFVLTIVGCADSSAENNRLLTNNDTVVLVHGLGRSGNAMWLLTRRLENSGYAVCTLDYASIGKSVQTVLETTENQINQCLESKTVQQAKVHFVGHSLGGLVIRSYLQSYPEFTRSERMGEAVLIGTPNQGSELADYYSDTWLIELGGEVTQSLITGEDTLGAQFNNIGIEFGVIAGTKSLKLTNNVFTGPNDGLVSVESTKLENMGDFIEIEVGHSSMRYNEEVANQTIFYLQNGHFQSD